ncbi:MAG: nucleotidyltransferase domain-containing protein [bacterium]|uniref:Nucleotidyltransferase domain-containing protein n=1 Tax=Candidatus Methylomirabilis tolerans TaxID=3123416 RepID=A0AAJ1EJ87_9BACT|nr:nucleotidyltransferase domain-containing protein [Candidatus Methylomirabilis sp.]
MLFGSAATGSGGRDLDLAVMPGTVPDLLEQGRWLAALESVLAPRAVDLLVLTTSVSPLIQFEVFRAGVCLFEAQEGLFDREQDRAFFLYADTGKFRRESLEVLRG